jgi:hypothetical protein
MFRFALRTARPTAPSVGRTFSTTPVAFKAQTVQEINASKYTHTRPSYMQDPFASVLLCTRDTILIFLPHVCSILEAKQLGIPPPPKAPLGAYAEFFRELYPKIRDNYVRENGRIDSHEVARVAGAQWNTLTEDDRKVGTSRAKRESVFSDAAGRESVERSENQSLPRP